MNFAQAQAGNAGFVAFQPPEFALDQRDLQLFWFRHVLSLMSLNRPDAQARISFTFLPRLAAMACGECISDKPLIVARTTLIGLREP